MPRALFPAVADERFHGNVGPLYAAIAIGSVLAGLSGGWIGRVRRQGRALVFAVVGWGGAVALSGLAHQLWLVVAAARRRRRRRPGQRGVPADDPADLRAGRDARPDAGRVHRRRRRRPAPRRRPRRRHGRRDQRDVLLGRRRHRVRRSSCSSPACWCVRSGATTRTMPRSTSTQASVRVMALTGQQFAIAAGEHEATIVEVGAGAAPLQRTAASTSPCPFGDDELPPRCCGAVLVPWPNRLRGGRYLFDGVDYQLPLTEPDTGQRDPRPRPLGAVDAGAARADAGDARARHRAAEGLPVRGARRGHLRAARRARPVGVGVGAQPRHAAARRSAPASIRTCPRTAPRSPT